MTRRIELEKLLAAEFGVPDARLEEPAEPEFGHYTTNLAFALAKKQGVNPEQAGQAIASTLEKSPLVERCEVVRGFVNIWLRQEALGQVIGELLRDTAGYSSSELGGGRSILYEFVSANPTGPLNVVSARAAAVGDVLVRLARRCGYRPKAEFYANDAGGQINALGESVAWRLGEREDAPPDGYLGEYLVPVAERLRAEGTERQDYGAKAAEIFLEKNFESLRGFGVKFDSVVRESEVRNSPYGEELLRLLEGHTEKRDGALFLVAEAIGDEKDRVLVRSNGEPTYLFWDMAYHLHKRERGYDEMVNLLGPDHHAEAKTLSAGLSAVGIANIRVKIIQQVHMVRGGQKVKMSKRLGEFYSLDELLDEVGPDAARFFLLMRSTSQPLEFDIDLAKTLARENPVYYVQYVHARTCSLSRFAGKQGVSGEGAKVSLLPETDEQVVLSKLLHLPDAVEAACRNEEPHLLAHYLLNLAALFHGFYQRHRIVTDDPDLSGARLALAMAVGAAMREGLGLLGVSAPESM